MTTVMTLGRCEFSEAPASIDQSGPVLVIEGELVCESYAELSARRAQLNGMVDNPDEDVFPATFAYTPEFDGFYAVELVQVGTTSAALVGFLAPYSVTLRAVTDSAQPKAEIQYVGTLRTNSHSISSSGSLFRSDNLEAWDTGDQSFASTVRESEDGVTFAWFNVHNNESDVVAYEPEPSAHYSGATSVDVLGADATWRPWTGRQLSRVSPADVRVNNGLCRFAISAAGVMTHSVWDPVAEAWESASFTLSGTPFASSFELFDACSGPTILRNDIDAVVVRYNMRPIINYLGYGSIFATVTLRAGDVFASVHLTATASQTKTLISASPAVAATGITGGLRRTSDDANGNRWVIGTPHTFTGDTTNGTVMVNYTATTTPTYMIGQALGGSGANAINAETAQITQFMLSINAKTRIVAR